MAARLGEVLFWVGLIMALPILALAVSGFGSWQEGAAFASLALIPIGLGRAAKYVLAGE